MKPDRPPAGCVCGAFKGHSSSSRHETEHDFMCKLNNLIIERDRESAQTSFLNQKTNGHSNTSQVSVRVNEFESDCVLHDFIHIKKNIKKMYTIFQFRNHFKIPYCGFCMVKPVNVVNKYIFYITAEFFPKIPSLFSFISLLVGIQT